MKIAVTYDAGKVFQHFGRTEQFMVFGAENGQITSSELLDSNGTGHGALAGLLAREGVDVLICGGIGGGAQQHLADAGIEVCSGAEGDVLEAVAAYLRGELTSAGATCHHHDHEQGHDCHCHDGCGEDCGGHCGEEEGGCHGCGHRAPAIEGKNVGRACKVHYRGTFNDGTQFDASYDRGEPLAFVCGAGQMIRGFDAAVADMDVGETRTVHLMPEEAYGPADPRMIFTLPIAQLPGSEELTVGERVYLSNAYGQPFPVKVTAKDDTAITLDANHEMAGKELNFLIELLEAN